MCGITGLLFLDRERNIDPAVLKGMTNTIVHRGPDDEGTYINKNVGLGFRRLSIIDVSLGHQPLSNADESIFIVFNGEIYNFQEHREMLKQKGYVFKTATDTEVILHLYEEYGVDCVQYLRGMFGFAIWDNNKQQLFCARDRFGIKPFFYYIDNEKFAFGSEIKTILKAGNIDKSLSYDAIDSFFAFGYITSDLSIYQHIKKLQPSHSLLIKFGDKVSVDVKRYWEIKYNPDYTKTEDYWKQEIEASLSETVTQHMISDVPLGAFLSGGIDSSSVVATMAKNSVQPIKTFSIGFKEQKFNELQYAREVAEMYKCEHHEQIVDPESISILSKLVNAYDEPFSDTSAIPTYYVSKFAREHVTVSLSGDGGDELFAGYSHYKYLQSLHKISSPSPYFNKFFWGNINKLIPQTMFGKGASYFLSKDRNNIGAYLCLWPEQERKQLFKKHLLEHITGAGSENFKENILRKGKGNDFMTNLQYLDLQSFMVDSVLTKVDRASMLNSLEVRVPILDHKFAELSFKIPWQLKYKGNSQKYIFKQAMANSLPKSILTHAKQGFDIPLSLWFKDDLKEYVHDNLLSNQALINPYFDKEVVKKIVIDNQTGMRDFSVKIWSLLFFEAWLQQNA